MSAASDSIGRMLTQENEKGHEQDVFYLSRMLQDTEKLYSNAYKWCLYDASIKLVHYFMGFLIEVVSLTDNLRHMVNQPFLKKRMSKWILHLLQFDPIHVALKAVKGQEIADFLTDHPCCEVVDGEEANEDIWLMYFDQPFNDLD